MTTTPPKYYRKSGGGIGMHKRSQSWTLAVFFSSLALGMIVWMKSTKGVVEPQNPFFYCFVFAVVVTLIYRFILVPFYQRRVEKVAHAEASKIASHEAEAAERAIANVTKNPRKYK